MSCFDWSYWAWLAYVQEKACYRRGKKKKLSKCKRVNLKWKQAPGLWLATSRHKQTGNGELKWGQLFQIKTHGRRWGQCQWRSLQSGSKQAALHHHHYHPAASITGHGPAAHSSDAEGSSYFGNLGAAVRKCYNCSFTVSTTDMTAVAQWGGGHTSRHPGLGNNQCCVHCFLSSSVHWWRSWAKTWGWW